MRRNFDEQLAFGREIEKAVGAWLMSKGLRILPVYDYSGLQENKAPRFTAAVQSESLVLPDLLGARDSSCRWYEVKYKHHADFTRKTQRLETGISLRLWKQYQQVEKVSGIPVWLLFAHRKEDEVRGEMIARLLGRERVYCGGKMGSAGMVFFAWDDLKRVEKLSAIMPALAKSTFR